MVVSEGRRSAGRVLWVWCFALLLGFAASARADDFSIIRVCVRPKGIPANVERWAMTPGGSFLVTANPNTFRDKTRGLTIFVFDPAAPPESVQLLPIPHNQRKCEPYTPPASAPAPPPPPPAGAGPSPPPRAGAGSGEKPAPAKEKAATRAQDEPPPGLPPPIVYPKNDPEPRPQPRPNGVTAHWPKTVLPIKRAQVDTHTKVLPAGTVLPIEREHVDTHTRVLPMVHVLPLKHEVGKGGNGDGRKGDAPIRVAEKTTADKIAEELAYAGAIANQQFNEDTKRPDGKQYGIPGGKNADGPNHPAVQAAAGAVLVGAAVLSAGASGFKKKLIKAVKEGEPIVYKEMAEVSEEVAEELAKKYGAKIADALNVNGAIGPYSVMRKFTEKLGGRWQAHHILEEQFLRDLRLGKPDLGPSVILTEAQHKKITAKLSATTKGVRNAKELWQKYKEVYADHPDWLEAIKPYFVKNK